MTTRKRKPKEPISVVPKVDEFATGSPTAADLDRHQENVEAENQARMDTERKQMYPERVGGVSPGDFVTTFPGPGNFPIEVDEDLIPSQPSVPYGGIALFSASLAILAILGTLWAMYYIVRPKLDIHVTVQQPVATSSAPTTQGWIVGGNDIPVQPKAKPQDYKPAPDSRDLSITANEDVWLKVTAKGRDSNVEHTLFQGSVQKGWEGKYALLPFIILDVRAGKERALDFKTADGGIAPVNIYMGSGKLAEYVFDGKDLLAQNK